MLQLHCDADDVKTDNKPGAWQIQILNLLTWRSWGRQDGASSEHVGILMGSERGRQNGKVGRPQVK